MGVVERRLQERRQREQLIIDAALRVFSEKGIKEATIDDIAAAAELGKGTIYYYFPSKEAILEEVIEATVDAHFEGLLERADPLRTPYEIAEAILTGSAENFQKRPAMFRVVYMVLAEPQGQSRKLLKGFIRRHLQWMEELKRLTAEVLDQHALEHRSFLSFLGTHVHGMMALASSGRPVEALLQDSLRALKAVLA